MTTIAPIKSGSSQQSTPGAEAAGSGGTTFAGILAVIAAPSQDQSAQPPAASPRDRASLHRVPAQLLRAHRLWDGEPRGCNLGWL